MKKYFEDYKCIDNNDINGGMEFAVRQILHVLPEFTDYLRKRTVKEVFISLQEMWTGRQASGQARYGLRMNTC